MMGAPTDQVRAQQSKLTRCCWLAALLALLVFAYQGARFAYRAYATWQNDKQAVEAEPLVVSEGELNVGEVLETNKYQHVITIRNRSNSDIHIQRIDVSCECLEVSPRQDFTVAAGQALPLSLTLRATILPSHKRFGRGYGFGVSVRARYSGEKNRYGKERTKEWLLQGTILPVITLSRQVVDVGTHSECATLPEELIEVKAEQPIETLRCLTTGDWKARVTKLDATAKPRFRIALSPNGRLTPRLVTDELTVIPVTADGKRLPAKEVRILGEIRPDIVATPAVIQAGRRKLGTKITEWVRVHSLTGRPFTIERVHASGELCARAVDGPASDGLYRVQLSVQRVGKEEATVTFDVRDQAGVKHALKVELSDEGQAK